MKVMTVKANRFIPLDTPAGDFSLPPGREATLPEDVAQELISLGYASMVRPTFEGHPSTTSKRKPHSDNVGYVAELKCKAPCGGHIVIYDRERGFDIDADHRWIVMHEPSSLHVSVPSLRRARAEMKDAAAGYPSADILPNSENTPG